MFSMPLIGVATAADGDLIFQTTITDSDMNLNSISIGESGTIYLYPYNTSKLYAFYPNGTEKWSISVGAGDYQADPVVGPNEIIYVANENNEVRAVYPNSTVKYITDINSYTYGKGQLSIDKNSQLYLTDGENVYCLNANGVLQWNITSPTGAGIYTPGSISDTNAMIYFGSWYEGAFALNTADGSTVWFINGSYEYIYSTPSLSFDESTLYGLTGDGDYAKLWAFDALTGALEWEYNTTDRIYARTPTTVLSDGAIVFGGHENWEPDALYCVESDGSLRWSQDFPIHSQVESGIIELADGSLITTQDANLFSINAATGAMTKIYETGGSTNRYGTPAVASNGNIYFTIDSDTFYGVEGSSAAKYNYADYVAGDVPNNFYIWHNQYENSADITLSNVRILSETTDDITIGWDAGVDVDNVKVYRGINTNLIGQSTSTEYLDANLISGTQYNYWLEPWDGAASGSKYAISGTTDSTGGGGVPTPTPTIIPDPTPYDDEGSRYGWGNFSITIPDFWKSPLWEILLFMVSSLLVVGYVSEDR